MNLYVEFKPCHNTICKYNASGKSPIVPMFCDYTEHFIHGNTILMKQNPVFMHLYRKGNYDSTRNNTIKRKE